MAHIGDAIKAARNRAGVSQRTLAGISGVSRATIAKLETHRHQSVTTAKLEAIAMALGVSMGELLTQSMPHGKDAA